MEIIKAKNLVLWLILLIIGIAMIAGPVYAWNGRPDFRIKNMDSGFPIKTKIIDEDNGKKDNSFTKESVYVLKNDKENKIYTSNQRWGPENPI